MKQPGLSVNLIIKNEERFLEDAILSVKNVADEIVIVDTGSLDKSLQIAQKHNCKIIHHNWQNSFSDARNVAILNSDYSWILYLDADERLDQESASEVLNIKATQPTFAYYTTVVNIDEKKGVPVLMKYTRLFPNLERVKFYGRVHEQLEDSLISNNIGFSDSGIKINHLGYNSDKTILHAKAKRNLDLLLLDYKEEKRPYTIYQIANSYAVLGQEQKAAEYYERASLSDDLNKSYKGICFSYLSGLKLKQGDIAEAQTLIKQAKECAPENPYILLNAAEIYTASGDKKSALDNIQSAYVLNKTTSGSSYVIQKIDSDKLLAKFYYILAINNRSDKIKQLITEEANSAITQFIVSVLNNSAKIDKIPGFVTESNAEELTELFSVTLPQDVYGNVLKQLSDKFGTPALMIKLGERYLNSNKFIEADKVLQEYIDQDGNNPVGWFYLLSVKLNLGDLNGTLETLSAAKSRFGAYKVVMDKLQMIENKLYRK